MFVISDGRFGDNRNYLKQWLRRAEEQHIFCIFIVVDPDTKKDSILEIQALTTNENGEMALNRYIDEFPFAFYVILRQINNLPLVLADALRQWFEIVHRDS